MKTKLIKSGLYVGTLTIVAGRGYLSYRYYNLTDVDWEDITAEPHLKSIIEQAKKYCEKQVAQLWAY